MIEKTSAYKTTDGQTHSTLADAKLHELEGLFDDAKDFGGAPVRGRVASAIVSNQERIIEILKTKERIRSKRATVPKKSRKNSQGILPAGFIAPNKAP